MDITFRTENDYLAFERDYSGNKPCDSCIDQLKRGLILPALQGGRIVIPEEARFCHRYFAGSRDATVQSLQDVLAREHASLLPGERIHGKISKCKLTPQFGAAIVLHLQTSAYREPFSAWAIKVGLEVAEIRECRDLFEPLLGTEYKVLPESVHLDEKAAGIALAALNPAFR